MGSIKRAPELTSANQIRRYARMSKADIVEAFRDLYREYGGAGELDDLEWLDDLERRITILKTYRSNGN